ncbi:MAG TPA: MFS transporter [Hyphomicrobiales bacterium]|nr:MFS transporter [Hyphomicrobiales bacterium]
MPSNPLLIPLIVACALFMENLDSTVLSTSLPAIAVDIGVNPVALKLALTSYLLSLAIFVPASGWVADRFGARLVFRAAIAVFVFGSIMCGLSSTLGGFVAARTVQGIGGAMMVPVGRLVVLRSIEKRDLVAAMAWVTIPALIGPMIGPPVGGFITTYLHWRWIFWINVPIGALGLVLATLFVPDIRGEEQRRFDFLGFVLSGIGLAGVVSGSTLLGLAFLPWWTGLAVIGFGGLVLAAYWMHYRRAKAPILDLGLFRTPTFRVGVTGGFLFRMGMGASPFLLPLLLQVIFGMSPLESGLTTFVGSAGALLMKFAAPPLIRAFGFRTCLAAAAVIGASFSASTALFTIATPRMVMMAVLFVGGFFRSMLFTAMNAVVYSDIEQIEMSRATSLSSVAQQVALSMGVSFGALTLEVSMAMRGTGVLARSDFVAAFLVVGVLCISAVPFFLRLRPDAGSAVSGHRRYAVSEAARNPVAST